MQDARAKRKRQYFNLPEGKVLDVNGIRIGLHLSGKRRGRRGTITIESDSGVKVVRLDKPRHEKQ